MSMRSTAGWRSFMAATSDDQTKEGRIAPGDWTWCRAVGSEVTITAQVYVAQHSSASESDESIVASATVMSHFAASASPLASIRVEVNTSAIASSDIALAQHVHLKSHVPHIPSALLSYELSSFLPLVFANRVISTGSLLQSSLLLSYRGVSSLQVQRVRSFGNNNDAQQSKAFLITPQTVISIQPQNDSSIQTALSPRLPSRQFASSASEWIDRTSHHMSGFHSTVSTWIQTMWNNVNSYRMNIEHPQAMNLTAYSPHTFLVHGLSGTGKTHVCRTVAACSGLPYYFLQASSLLQRVEGATESALVQLFQNARALNEPCVLILDEIDAILPRNAADSDGQGGADEDDATNGAAVLQERGVGWKMGNSRIEWRVAAVLKDLLHELNSIDIPLPGFSNSFPSPVVPPIFVFFTTSSLTSLEVSGLRMSPFVDQEIELKALTLEERIEALQMSTKQLNFEAGIERQTFATQLAAQLHGYVSADIDGFVRELVLRALKRCRVDVSALTASPLKASQVAIRREDVDAVLEWFRPSNLQQLEFRLPVQSSDNQTTQLIAANQSENSPLPLQAVAHHFDSLAGITTVLKQLHYSFLLPIKQPNLYKNFWQSTLGMKASKGVLIYGQSGVGKTSVAMCLARACGLNAMVVPSTSLVSKVVGSAEKSLANLFAKARASAPSLLIFDQMEMIAPVRKGLVSSSNAAEGPDADDEDDSRDVDAYERMLSVLLIEMDGVLQSNGASDQVYVVATSTRPDLIDPALLRPSRLDSHVHIPPPSQADRLEILKHLFKNTPIYVQTDEQNRIIMPQQFSLAFAVLDAEVQKRVTLREWNYAIPSNAAGPQAASDEPLIQDLLVFLSHVTHAYSGADLVALQRESALHALRRDLSSCVVLSWTDMLQSSLRSMRGSLESQTDYHPFGVKQAGAAFTWQQSEQYSGTRMTHTVGAESQRMFSHRSAAEMAVKSVVTTSVVTNTHTTPIKSIDSPAFVFEAASFSVPAQAPTSPSAFVFESTTVSGPPEAATNNPFAFSNPSTSSSSASGFAVGSSEADAAAQRTPKKRAERFQNIKDRF